MRFAFRLASWVLFVAIVAMTLGPVSLRPHTPFPPDLDRIAAYGVLGIFFAFPTCCVGSGYDDEESP
jgi:hypothetical protein